MCAFLRYFVYVRACVCVCVSPFLIYKHQVLYCRSQWPRGLRRRSAAARLLRSWFRITPGAWKFVCCESCVSSGRGLYGEMITRPEESYRLWCVVVCDLETSRMRRPWPALGRSATVKKKGFVLRVYRYVTQLYKSTPLLHQLPPAHRALQKFFPLVQFLYFLPSAPTSP